MKSNLTVKGLSHLEFRKSLVTGIYFQFVQEFCNEKFLNEQSFFNTLFTRKASLRETDVFFVFARVYINWKKIDKKETPANEWNLLLRFINFIRTRLKLVKK